MYSIYLDGVDSKITVNEWYEAFKWMAKRIDIVDNTTGEIIRQWKNGTLIYAAG